MDIDEFINARLDVMLAHPLRWGGAEAFELQVLLLLELQRLLRDPASRHQGPREHVAEYTAFLQTAWEDLGPRPLSAVTSDLGEIARELSRFRAATSEPDVASPDGPAPSAPEDLGRDVVVGPDSSMPRAA